MWARERPAAAVAATFASHFRQAYPASWSSRAWQEQAGAGAGAEAQAGAQAGAAVEAIYAPPELVFVLSLLASVARSCQC